MNAAPDDEAGGGLPRPGLVGLVVRFVPGVLLVLLGWSAIRDAPSYFDGYTEPLGSVLPILVLAWFTRPVVNELVQRPWGWWPSTVAIVLLALAAVVGAVQGDPFGPVYGTTLWVWTVVILFLLGPAFLLAVVLRTPGCEMRSYADLWARVRGKDPRQAACPGFIDRWDHVRLFGRF